MVSGIGSEINQNFSTKRAWNDSIRIQRSSEVRQRWQKPSIARGFEANRDWGQVNNSRESIVARYNSSRDSSRLKAQAGEVEREKAG